MPRGERGSRSLPSPHNQAAVKSAIPFQTDPPEKGGGERLVRRKEEGKSRCVSVLSVVATAAHCVLPLEKKNTSLCAVAKAKPQGVTPVTCLLLLPPPQEKDN